MIIFLNFKIYCEIYFLRFFSLKSYFCSRKRIEEGFVLRE